MVNEQEDGRWKSASILLIIWAGAIILDFTFFKIEQSLDLEIGNIFFTAIHLVLGMMWYILPAGLAILTRNTAVMIVVGVTSFLFLLNHILSTLGIFSIYWDSMPGDDFIYFQF